MGSARFFNSIMMTISLHIISLAIIDGINQNSPEECCHIIVGGFAAQEVSHWFAYNAKILYKRIVAWTFECHARNHVKFGVWIFQAITSNAEYSRANHIGGESRYDITNFNHFTLIPDLLRQTHAQTFGYFGIRRKHEFHFGRCKCWRQFCTQRFPFVRLKWKQMRGSSL